MLRNTKIIAFFITLCFFSYSCCTYQYYSVEGTLAKSQFSDFFYENDTLQIIYTFNGINGPVTTKIYNKLEIPIYINWKKSFSNINGKSFFDKDNMEYINDSLNADNFPYSSFPKTERIDPQSQLVTVHTNLNNQFIKVNKSQNHDFIYKQNPHSKYPSKIKEYKFTENDSPIFYKNHISYSASPENKDLNFIESEFWVSKIFKTTQNDIPESPDRFVVTKINNAGVTIGITAIACISFLSVLAVPAQTHP